MSFEIQKADPRARRNAVLLIAVISLVAIASAPWLAEVAIQLERWISEDPGQSAERLGRLLVGAAAAIAVPLFGLAFWLYRFATRIRRAGRFPPPGVSVVRDTRVAFGSAAVRRAWFFYFLAFYACALGLAAPIVLWRAFCAVAGGAA